MDFMKIKSIGFFRMNHFCLYLYYPVVKNISKVKI